MTDDICVVSQPLSSVGVTTTQNLLEILSAITNVVLITPDLPGDSTLEEKYEIVELGTGGTGQGILTQAYRFVINQVKMSSSILRREEEVILFYGTTLYLLPIIVAKIRGKTVFLEPRGDVPLTLTLTWKDQIPTPVAIFFGQILRVFERLGFFLSDAIITYTPEMANQLDLARYEDKLYTHGARFIDTGLFQPVVPYKNRNNIVGYLGRIDKEKGIETLEETAKALPEEIIFRFIGDGDLLENLQQGLADEISSGDIEVTGWVDHNQVPEELSRLKLLVMPSAATEGLPTTILESMACGTPVLATPVSGIPDVIQEEQTGFFIQHSSPSSIARQIEEILDRKNLSTMSMHCRHFIKKEYSFKSAVQRYEHIFNSISDRNS